MIVMKFGGTSVANTEAIRRAAAIVAGRLDRKPVVVVSALSGVTDTLCRLAEAAGRGDSDTCASLIAGLEERHLTLVDELMEGDSAARAQARRDVCDVCGRLASFTGAVCTLGELTPRSNARIVATGEWLSSTVMGHAMNSMGIATGFADARRMIVTSGPHMKGEPATDAIAERVPAVIAEALAGNATVITQGFIASNAEGETTVLGRGGSDYTASLIGMALNAEAIEIWTDVDGMRTTDPRRITNTQKIGRISFEEAAEMAHFGAKVLHPLTIEPAVRKNIAVHVLNSTNPDDTGTVILQSDRIVDGVKAVSFKENILMLNIFSTKMIDTAGFLSRVFGIFADNGVSVDLISTSEANISVTVDSGSRLDEVVRQLSSFAVVHVYDDKAQLSVIGKNVVKQRGLLRWALGALNNTNIHMISQGASSINISYVVDRSDLDEVLQELHKYLFEY